MNHTPTISALERASPTTLKHTEHTLDPGSSQHQPTGKEVAMGETRGESWRSIASGREEDKSSYTFWKNSSKRKEGRKKIKLTILKRKDTSHPFPLSHPHCQHLAFKNLHRKRPKP